MTDRDSVLEWSAIETAYAIRTGQVSALGYAETILHQAGLHSDLEALTQIDGEAFLAAAREADSQRASHAVLGPLHGVPFVVKDNIDVAGFATTAGTPALRDNRPAADSEVVAALKAAGAIVLGKANMHELAAGVTTTNAAFGTSRNPVHRDHVPGGSSGGTAAAVAARLCPFGLGTDTGASNRVPAAYCGIIGFRPTTGRWSQAGLAMNCPTRDTIGPMARTMDDIRLLDTIVTGHESSIPRLNALRLGIPRDTFWQDLDVEVSAMCEEFLRTASDADVTLVDVELNDMHELANLTGLPIAMAELRPALQAYLDKAGSRVTVADILAQIASPDVQAFFAAFPASGPDGEYQEALTLHRVRLQALYSACLQDNRLDGIIFPTSPILPPRISDGDQISHNGRLHSTLWLAVRNTNPGSLAAVPGVSLPVGRSRTGLPVGIEIDGRIGGDAALLGIAGALEALLPAL